MINMPGDIINLQKCTKNYDHVIHSSWYMERNRQQKDRQTEKVTYGGGCPT